MPHKPPVHRPAGLGDRRQQRRAYDRQREKQDWRRWYKTARWQRRRKAQLIKQPLFENCLKYGRVTAVAVADHADRHNGEYDHFWYGKL